MVVPRGTKCICNCLSRTIDDDELIIMPYQFRCHLINKQYTSYSTIYQPLSHTKDFVRKFIASPAVTIPVYNVILEPVEIDIDHLEVQPGSFADDLEKFYTPEYEESSTSDTYKFSY